MLYNCNHSMYPSDLLILLNNMHCSLFLHGFSGHSFYFGYFTSGCTTICLINYPNETYLDFFSLGSGNKVQQTFMQVFMCTKFSNLWVKYQEAQNAGCILGLFSLVRNCCNMAYLSDSFISQSDE